MGEANNVERVDVNVAKSMNLYKQCKMNNFLRYRVTYLLLDNYLQITNFHILFHISHKPAEKCNICWRKDDGNHLLVKVINKYFCRSYFGIFPKGKPKKSAHRFFLQKTIKKRGNFKFFIFK